MKLDHLCLDTVFFALFSLDGLDYLNPCFYEYTEKEFFHYCIADQKLDNIIMDWKRRLSMRNRFALTI